MSILSFLYMEHTYHQLHKETDEERQVLYKQLQEIIRKLNDWKKDISMKR